MTGAPGPDDVRDAREHWTVVRSDSPFRGPVFSVRSDEVVMPASGGGTEKVRRDVVEHQGSVAVLALDDADRVLLLRQYRHAVGALLWELPAGLRDVPGEPLRDVAARELLEESGYRADRWDALVDVLPSPGMSDERSRIFLARDVARVPDDEIDFERVHEEADMPVVWVPLADAVRKVLAGDVRNALAVQGILAAHAYRNGAGIELRPADAPEL
ncbi:NUDIX domain-containing protein [Actinomadura atramentaria]|uniref:NUDIX domain-containing protein n=1 Tax=Actinomadura atramentaria TaxID=1990 RepID=UPI0003616BE2|nr:NUDIX hydrolase [Actinomadura atramentaria]